MKRSSQTGSHVVMLALVLLFVGVVGFTGYRVWSMEQAAVPSSTATNSTVPAKITNTATLNQAATALDSSSTQLNSSLDDSALNNSLNALL